MPTYRKTRYLLLVTICYFFFQFYTLLNVERNKVHWRLAVAGITVQKWNKPHLTIPKASLHRKKVMLCVWRDWKLNLYYRLFLNNETINSEKYFSQLHGLKTAIELKRPEIANRKDVGFHQDNARLGVSLITWQSCWSSIEMFYAIHHIHQTSRPLIRTRFDHYKIPLMVQIKKSPRKVFLLKNLRDSKRTDFQVAWKMKKGCRTEWHPYTVKHW